MADTYNLKQKISEYIYEKNDGLSILERFIQRSPLDSSCKCLSDLLNYIWVSYCYEMGRTKYWWKTSPPPPLIAPVWLEEHLAPILSKWIDKQLALSSSGQDIRL